MKITAILGSPRRGGNSEILLDWALTKISENGQDGHGGHEIQRFRPDSMNIAPCLNCGGCEQSGICVVDDDMAQVYEAIKNSDRFIVCSPIFFFGMPAQIKALIDRCQAIWAEKYLLNRSIVASVNGRKGLLILVGGLKMKVGFDCGDASITAFFRSISVPVHQTISFMKVDDKGAIKDSPDAMNKVNEAVINLLKTN